MSRENVVRGTITLTAAGIINRTIGFLYNLYLIRMVGAESIGIFRMVFSVYVTLLVIASAGIPYAVSKMVADRKARGDENSVRPVMATAVAIVSVTSFVVVLICYALSDFISGRILSDPRSVSVLTFIVPGLFITSLASVYRGYFQGLENMTPPAISQVIEQVTRAVITLWLAHYLVSFGPEYVAASIAVGMVVGETVGLAYIVSRYRRQKTTDDHRPVHAVTGEMLSLSFPAAAGRIIASLSSTINVIIISARLRAGGCGVREASELLGLLMGVALPLVFLPNIVNVALSLSLVPSIASSLARGKKREARHRAEEALVFTFSLGLPLAVVLGSLGGQLTGFLYGQPQAGPILSLIAAGAVFAYLRQTSSGILQGMGLPSLPVRNYIIAITADSLIVYFLAARPEFGITGAALSSVANFIISGGLNIWEVARRLDLRIKIKHHLGPPLFGAFLMYLTIEWLQPGPVMPVAAAGFIVYFLCLWFTRFPQRWGFSALVKRKQ